MFARVPSYVDRRLTQVNIAEQKLPFEPSFGWVGRTDFLHSPYRSNEEAEIIQDYDQYRF